MTLALLVYAIGTLTALNIFIFLLALVTLSTTFICTMTTLDREGIPKMWKWGIPLAIFLLTTSVLLPSEKTAYTMVGRMLHRKLLRTLRCSNFRVKYLSLLKVSWIPT